MANVTVSTFTPSGSSKYMVVDTEVVEIAPGGSITFENNLTPPEDISIRFYQNQTAKNGAVALTGFCGGAVDAFPVPKGTGGSSGTATCTVATGYNENFYLYTVSAAAPYVTLDPVLILDKPPPFSPTVIIILTAVAGLAVGAQSMKMYLAGKSERT